MSDYDPDPWRVVEPEEERPLPWEDTFYDGNDGEEDEWPPRRRASWNGEGWPGPEDWWP
jgi:hypothetical protein